MKVLNISSDRNIFKEGSVVRARMIEYGTLFEELHIIVFCPKKLSTFPPPLIHRQADSFQLSTNVRVYPTNSCSKWLYIFDAIRIGKRIIRNWKSARTNVHSDGLKIENSRNDLVISSQDPFECGLAAYQLSKLAKLSLHIQIHTDFLSPYFASLSLLNRLRVLIARHILPKANAVRVVSQRIKNSLEICNLPVATEPTVLPIFANLEKFKIAEPVFSLQEKYSHWGFIILAVARLSPEKNIAFAIKILQEILKTYPKTGLVIVGDGSLGESLKFKVKSLKLDENVAFEGWQENTVSYYKTANLFLQTSLYEGFGLSLLEALASGCPAVSSDVGIAPEILNHKGHSFVCPVNDLACFVSTISQLIEDNQLRIFFSTQIAPAAVLPFVQSKEYYLRAYKMSLENYRANIR